MHLRRTALLSLTLALCAGVWAQEELRPRDTLYTDRADDARWT